MLLLVRSQGGSSKRLSDYRKRLIDKDGIQSEMAFSTARPCKPVDFSSQVWLKSAGLTNALRVLGKSAAVLVLAGDVAKGVIACLVGLRLGVYVYPGGAVNCVSLLAAGAGAFAGHNWPVYFRFKGGKGALTATAVMFMINWVMALISLGVFVVIVASTRYVSLGTICASLFFVAISFAPVFGGTFYFHIFASLMALIIIIKHRENIQRLFSGTENKLTSLR